MPFTKTENSKGRTDNKDVMSFVISLLTLTCFFLTGILMYLGLKRWPYTENIDIGGQTEESRNNGENPNC